MAGLWRNLKTNRSCFTNVVSCGNSVLKHGTNVCSLLGHEKKIKNGLHYKLHCQVGSTVIWIFRTLPFISFTPSSQNHRWNFVILGCLNVIESGCHDYFRIFFGKKSPRKEQSTCNSWSLGMMISQPTPPFSNVRNIEAHRHAYENPWLFPWYCWWKKSCTNYSVFLAHINT